MKHIEIKLDKLEKTVKEKPITNNTIMNTIMNTINIQQVYMMKPIHMLNTFYNNNPPLSDVVKYIQLQNLTQAEAQSLEKASRVENTDFMAMELNNIIKNMNRKFIEEAKIEGNTCDPIVFTNDGSVRKYIAKGQSSWIYMSDENSLDDMISYIFDKMCNTYNVYIHYLKKERADIIKKIKKLNSWETEKLTLIDKLTDVIH